MDASPEIVNEKPYAVWLFKIKPTSIDSLTSDLNALLSLAQYESGPGA
jgi:glycine cleavage system H protein